MGSACRLSDLSPLGGVRIAYLRLDKSLLVEVEKALINWFQPPLNRRSINPVRERDYSTIGCSKEQRKTWRHHCKRLGLTDTQLFDLLLPALKQIKGVPHADR